MKLRKTEFPRYLQPSPDLRFDPHKSHLDLVDSLFEWLWRSHGASRMRC